MAACTSPQISLFIVTCSKRPQARFEHGLLQQELGLCAHTLPTELTAPQSILVILLSYVFCMTSMYHVAPMSQIHLYSTDYQLQGQFESLRVSTSDKDMHSGVFTVWEYLLTG